MKTNYFWQLKNCLTLFLVYSYSNLSLFGQNNIQDSILINQLKEIDYKIDSRKYKDAKLLLEKTEKDIKKMNASSRYAINLRFFKIQYYEYNNEEIIDELLKNLDFLAQKETSITYYSYCDFIGQVFKDAKNFNKSIKYYRRAIRNAEIRNDTIDIIFSCLKLGSCYYRGEYEDTPQYYKNNLDSTLFYYNKALKFPETPKNNRFLTRIYDNLSKIQLAKGNVSSAENYANKALRINRKINNSFGIAVSLLNLSNVSFYKNEYLKAIEYSKKSNYFIGNKSISIRRDNLEDIAENYEKLGNYKLAHQYSKETNILSKKISKAISNKKINSIEAKYRLVKEKQLTLQEKNRRLQIQLLLNSAIFLIIIILALGLFYYTRNKNYKKRFEELINSQQKSFTVEQVETNPKKATKIPPKIVKNILDNLDLFEENKAFLTKNITMREVAKTFNTNSSYLSKVVNSYKNKNFTTYLNELRIQYAIEELKQNPELCLYTIEAIAETMGYNNGESFSLAFRKITGLYPSYFIKQLQKNQLDNQ